MTDKEMVIRALECCISMGDNLGGSCPKDCYYNGTGMCHTMLPDVLSILKGQEPQKAIRSRDYIEGIVTRCPKCKEKIYKHNGNYCSRCGQAVKWDD